jgi:hypothetical protein
MNLRHATALALVGWYLMCPPPDDSTFPSFALDVDAPVSKWWRAKSFDTAADCQEDLRRENREHAAEAVDHPTNLRERTALALKLGECISTDDPRLKGN